MLCYWVLQVFSCSFECVFFLSTFCSLLFQRLVDFVWMCNYAFHCLYFLFFESWQILQKLLMCVYVGVSIYFIACILGRLMDFAKSQACLCLVLCVFSFVFMCPILEKFVLRDVLVEKLNFFGSRGWSW